MFYGLVESSVEIPSGRLDYVAFGKGRRALVLIPGLNVRDVKGAGASLAVGYGLFARDYRVYCFDRRAKVREGLTNWDLAEDIHQAMQALGIGEADVFGVSQGGMIALALTLEHPERVRKLVLAVTAARTNGTLRQTASRWVACARAGDFAAINRDTFTLMYSERKQRQYRLLIPLLVRLVRPKDPERFAVLAGALLDFDCYDRLDEIRCPVLVLGAERDMITTAAASRELAGRLNCPLHMYPELGHAAYEEARDFNSRVYTFLTE